MSKSSRNFMPHNLIIIQARMSSNRLPGKVLKPIWEGMNVLDLQHQRLKDIGIPFVLATTLNPSDDSIVGWAKENQVEVFRGDEQNVLKRFIDCANEFNAVNLIRLCSDNPFIQIDQVPKLLNALEEGLDYISYCNDLGVPAIKTHWGLFVEGVRLNSLKRTFELLQMNSQKTFYFEHVTNFLYENPNQFKVKLVKAPEVVASRSDLRFTIDTEEDFNNMRELLKLGGNQKTLKDLVALTERNPHILMKMQKGIRSFFK